MKKPIILLFFLAAAALCFADPVEGFWLSVDEKTNKVTAGWQIYQEGGKQLPHSPFLCYTADHEKN